MSVNVIEGDYTPEDWFGEVRIDGRPLSPAASLRVANHSPDGFAWGYPGSGPAQLALGILLGVGVPERVAVRHYQAFKRAFLVAPDDQAPLRLEVDVLAWVATLERPTLAAGCRAFRFESRVRILSLYDDAIGRPCVEYEEYAHGVANVLVDLVDVFRHNPKCNSTACPARVAS